MQCSTYCTKHKHPRGAHDKIIFTPKIIYGLDSTLVRPIICYYMEVSISPKAMVQQICRARNITSLHFYFGAKKFSPFWMGPASTALVSDWATKPVIDVFIKDCREQNCAADKIFKIHCSKQILDNYLALYSRIHYDNKCHSTNKYVHFMMILRSRGFDVTSTIAAPPQHTPTQHTPTHTHTHNPKTTYDQSSILLCQAGRVQTGQRVRQKN